MTADERAAELEAAVGAAMARLRAALPRDWPALSAPLLAAQNALAAAFEKLAYKVAGRVAYKFPLVDLQELGRECLVALVRASRSWEPGRGSSFKTWAWNGCYFHGRTVAGRMNHLGFTGLTQNPTFRPGLVDTLSHDGERNPIADKFLAPEVPEPDLTPWEVRERLGVALAGLSERHRDVLRMRYVEGLTLEQVAAKWGLSRERIRQIQGAALRAARETGVRA